MICPGLYMLKHTIHGKIGYWSFRLAVTNTHVHTKLVLTTFVRNGVQTVHELHECSMNFLDGLQIFWMG